MSIIATCSNNMISSIEAIGTIQFIEYMPQTKALLDRNGLQTQTAELTSDSSSDSLCRSCLSHAPPLATTQTVPITYLFKRHHSLSVRRRFDASVHALKKRGGQRE